MADYTVTFHQRLDDYAVVQTLTNTPLELGVSFTLAGLGHGLNGTHTVRALPQYLFLGTDETTGELLYDTQVAIQNQVLFYDQGDDLERTAALPTGTLAYTPTCTWITAQQILDWLGISVATAADQAFVTQCASASNAFCFRRRQESGYVDSLTTSPSGDVSLGAIQYGGMLYRQRGSISSYAEFDQVAANGVTGLSGVIKQLLGIDRPQVA